MRLLPRVLLVGPDLLCGWTESTARALESLGCPTTALFYNRSPLRRGITHFRRSFAKRLGLSTLNSPRWLQSVYLNWLLRQKIQDIMRTAATFRPDLVFILKGQSFRPEMLQQLKDMTGAKLAVWWQDHPFMNAETRQAWPHLPKCLPLFDHCFVFDRSYIPQLSEAGAAQVTFLPCAADPELFMPQCLPAVDQESYGASISLLGTYYESRARIVSALADESNLGVWGPGWKDFFAQRENGNGRAFRGEALFPSEACKIYNASLVNLNTHHAQTQVAGLNSRTFEILAAGGFELTDHVREMETLLHPGQDLVVYRTSEEAIELARHYVKAAAERRRIAESGRRHVLAEHTFRHRMMTVLATI